MTSIASPRAPLSPNVYQDAHRSFDASLYESPYASPRAIQKRSLVTRVDNEVIWVSVKHTKKRKVEREVQKD